MKKILLVSAFFFVVSTRAQQIKPTSEDGKVVFKTNCVTCHGFDGKLGHHGAKNLQISKLDDSQLLKIIANGKWRMPKWKKVLTPAQISAVVEYVKTLRTN